MNLQMDKHIEDQLESFISKLRKGMPTSNLFLQVKEVPKDDRGRHRIVLQVMDPDFQFDVQADGQNLDNVLSDLEETLGSEMSQRRAMLIMMAEGIEQSSPQYNRYLH